MDIVLYILPAVTGFLGFWAHHQWVHKKTADQKELLLQKLDESEKALSNFQSKLQISESKQQESEKQFQLRIDDKELAFNKQINELKSVHDEQVVLLKENQKTQNQQQQSYFENQLNEQKAAFEKRIVDQKEQFDRLHHELKLQFQNMANDILEEKSKKIDEASERNLKELLNPLKEKLHLFENQIKDSYDKEARERFSMQRELKSLLEMNQQLSSDAKSLTQALKGDSKTQGDWGEVILERILEQSGLQEGREYFKQMNLKDEDQKNLRPDFVIQYPGDRFLVVDSKVSLRAYEDYRQAEDESLKASFLKKHLDAIKIHIQQLSDKKYDDYVAGGSLDFVLMFMPIEGAFITAMQHDKELWNNAFNKRILLISPTNLIAAMRMIATLWKHDAQNRNVMAIAEESGKLYDKFVGFVEDLDKVDNQLKNTRTIFDKAYSKLSSGRGNLVGKAENLKKLGAKAKKSLPQDYLTLSQHDHDEA
jgi:DNA recombination protein RmuC